MNFKNFYLTVLSLLLASSALLAQKNLVKPNVQSHYGVSVNTFSGALFYQRQDLYIPGRGQSLDIKFSYSNVSKDKDWGYGKGWTHSYNMSYYMDTTDIVIVHADGSRNRYVPNGSGGWLCPTGNFDLLEQYQPNQFRLTNREGMKYFFDNSTHKKLTKIEDRNSNAINLSYTDTLLTSLTDPSGRMVNLTWVAGRLSKITDPNTSPARMITFQYDIQGNPIKVTDPLGNFVQYEYDDEFKMTTVVNENGAALSIEYNSVSSVRRLVSCVGIQQLTYNYELLKTYVVEKVSGAEQITTYQYDTLGRLEQQIGNCCGVNVLFEYDADNNVTKRVDANGNATTFTYDSRGNLLTETDPLGNTMSYTYTANFSQVASETDRLGSTTVYTYDGNGNLTQVSRPLGVNETFTYDGFGNLLTFTDARGNTTTNTYDSHGNRTSVTNPLSGVTTFTYDGVGNDLSMTDPKNQTTTAEYDLLDRQTKLTNPLGGVTEFEYDAVGNQTSFKDENNHVTELSFDALNRLTSTTDPLGNTFTYKYDEKGNVTELKDRNGNKTKLEYDELNRLVKKTTPAGDVTIYDYDGVGNLTSAGLPGGNDVNLSYDPLNRLVSINDVLGVIASYAYDKNSNRTLATDGNGNSTRHFFDALDRLIRTEDPAGQAILFTYDANSNLTQTKDRRNQTSIFTYDALNRRTSSKDPLNNVTNFAYDPNGNQLTLTDAKGNVTTYAYDARNRSISETYANGNVRSFSYDPAGNIISRTEPNGYTVNFNYDAADRLTSRTYPGGITESFTYDAQGRILTATNAHSTVSLAYDGADRIVSETLNGRTTSFTYSPNALTRQITYPGSKQVLETYDQRARLLRLDDNSLPGDPLAEFTYDPANRLLELAYANGTGSEFAYDINSNVIQIDHSLTGLPARFQYDHDANDNKLFEQNVNQPTKSNQFIYDIYNRLAQFKTGTLAGGNIPSPIDNILYNHDAAHNRTTTVLNGATTTYASNTLNQYTLLSGAMSATLTYDNNGNLLADGLHTYAYDYENRLSTVDGGATAKYFYDALSRRILKVAGADSTFYFYAETKVIEERGNGGVLEAAYVFGEKTDEVLTMERGGNRYYFYQNSLGSVTHAANSTGVLVERYEYDAYGNVAFFNGAGSSIPVSAIENPLLFTGQRWDAESGLYFYKSRYYSPRLGRFLQRDPLDYIDGPSLYEYVFSNPANFTDPWGLCSTPCNKKPWWESPLDWFQTGLDVAGLVPGLGEIADGLNAGIYLARGDYTNAALSAAAMIPIGGQAATAAKFANKADNFADAARAAYKTADGRKPIIIGENVDRVKAYADEVGGHAYRPWKNEPFDADLGMRRNERWIKDQMRDGREIIDIGPDWERRAQRAADIKAGKGGREPASPFYEMERKRTKDYENYRKEFDRNGKYNDGKEGARPPKKGGGCN